MSVVTTVDTSYNTSITVELSRNEEYDYDKRQLLGYLLLFGMYFVVIAVLVLL